MQESNYLSQQNSTKFLSKDLSKVSITNTSCSSTSSLSSLNNQPHDDQYRKLAAKWILTYSKKLSKDTQFSAINYLNRLQSAAIFINEQNYETIALATLLIACKVNQISTPKISTILAKCKKIIDKQQILQMESQIILGFDFDMACKGTIYSIIKNMLGNKYSQKIQDCQKLLRVVCTDKQIYQFGDKILAHSIILLIFPEFQADMKPQEVVKVRRLARQIFVLYSQAKKKHEQQKRKQAKQSKN